MQLSAVGAVIRGDTSHYDLSCAMNCQGDHFGRLNFQQGSRSYSEDKTENIESRLLLHVQKQSRK